MPIRIIAAASTGIALALVLGSGTAHADPPGNTPNDAENARNWCMEVADNPTAAGLMAATNHLGRRLSNDDMVDAAAYGLLYVCPEYRGLFAQTYKIYGSPQPTA